MKYYKLYHIPGVVIIILEDVQNNPWLFFLEQICTENSIIFRGLLLPDKIYEH
jgi:hypothetical protein